MLSIWANLRFLSFGKELIVLIKISSTELNNRAVEIAEQDQNAHTIFLLINAPAAMQT